MQTIHKFPVEPSESFLLELPESFRVLSVEVQENGENVRPVLYIMLDPKATIRKNVAFHVYPTGAAIDESVARRNDYLGCINLNLLVFHVLGPRSGGSFALPEVR